MLIACRSNPEQIGPGVTDDGSPLSLAVSEAGELDDPMMRATLYLDLGNAYIDLGDEQNAAVLADEILTLAQASGASEESIRMQLRVAPLFYDAARPERSGEVLISAVQLIRAVEFPQVRAGLLAEAVKYALLCGDSGLPTVRAAVDEAYVLEDPATRVDTLISVARLYQQGGTALSVTSLIHQSVPSVRSIPNPRQRAYLFGRLAGLANAARETDIRDRLVEDAMRELGRDAPSDTVNDRYVADLVRILSEIGARSSAAIAADLVADPQERVRALVALASGDPGLPVAPQLLQSASDAAEQVSGNVARAESLLTVADAYLSRADMPAAARLADEVQSLLEAGAAAGQRLDLFLGVVHVIAGSDPGQLSALINGQTDPFVRGSVATAAADQLGAAGEPEIAKSLLTTALASADMADYLPDVLRLGVIRSYIGLGDPAAALAVVGSMVDPVLRTQAIVVMAVAISGTDSNETLTAEYRRLFLRRGTAASR